MPETIVAVYRRIEDTRAIRRSLEEIGIAPDDLHISDYVDPVQANAPASIEKPKGWFYFLSGIPDVDVDAYRRAVARGRTIVAVRAADEKVEPTIATLEGFDPVELDEAEVAAVGAAASQEGAGPATRAGSASTGGATGRLRRYLAADRGGTR